MKKFTITCYGKTESYPESRRKEMMNYYLEGMASCDGSEKDRYANIYVDLAEGKVHCFDEDMLEWEVRRPSNGRTKKI